MSTKMPRLLRMSIQVYRNTSHSEAEGYEFIVNNFGVHASRIHAKHGMHSYKLIFHPSPVRQVIEAMSRHGNRNWVTDDHDVTVEFYFRSFEEVDKVTNDPDFQRLQAEEAPYISKTPSAVSLGWVETFVEEGKVVNVENGRSTYGSWEESVDLSNAMPKQSTPILAPNNS